MGPRRHVIQLRYSVITLVVTPIVAGATLLGAGWNYWQGINPIPLMATGMVFLTVCLVGLLRSVHRVVLDVDSLIVTATTGLPPLQTTQTVPVFRGDPVRIVETGDDETTTYALLVGDQYIPVVLHPMLAKAWIHAAAPKLAAVLATRVEYPE